jgi:hypothetical protein
MFNLEYQEQWRGLVSPAARSVYVKVVMPRSKHQNCLVECPVYVIIWSNTYDYLQCREVNHDDINTTLAAEITEFKFLLEEIY